ncbi:uncharacterized protein LOC127010632 [Drosophila biarmipes]|uniref:uncharacterized protein LOC127010632 n=1 Tax=Drosophila biarmipes TaxID=125945 RepID=UPI0021CD1602|nr:uncharacterized protein LOC127010632 [Drosophila biarmipes]
MSSHCKLLEDVLRTQTFYQNKIPHVVSKEDRVSKDSVKEDVDNKDSVRKDRVSKDLVKEEVDSKDSVKEDVDSKDSDKEDKDSKENAVTRDVTNRIAFKNAIKTEILKDNQTLYPIHLFFGFQKFL